MSLAPVIDRGTLLGARFRVLGVLGQGGMATVYLAEDVLRGERIALKVLHPHLTADPGNRARLQREVQASTRVRHPAALTAHELHEADGRLFLTMPYHTGRTLAERIAAEGALPVEQVRALGVTLAEVLAEAHRHGVLHRDVTPNNVMLDEQGRPALMDFGLARLEEQGGRSTGVLGTAGYVGPEVYAGTRGDPRSDLYGLGATLYQAATGQPPFGTGTPAAVLQRQLQGSFPPSASVRPSLPADLAALIDALLDQSPDARPGGADDVVLWLKRKVAPPETLTAAPAPAPAPAAPPALPTGTWAVIVQRRRRQQPNYRQPLRQLASGVRQFDPQLGAVAERIVEAVTRTPEERLVAAVAELSHQPQLTVPNAMRQWQFRLVDGVDRPTAQLLRQAARHAGFRAWLVPTAQNFPVPMQRALRLHPVQVLLMMALMVAPFMVLPFIGVPLAILLGILFVTFNVLRSGQPDRMDVAFDNRLPQAPPIAAPPPIATPAPPPTRGGALLARANSQLDSLERALQQASNLPELAVAELRRSIKALREEARASGAEVDRLEQELQKEEGEDLAWAAARLRRLETLQAAGEVVEQAELDRLSALLAARARAETARGAVEARLTGTIARLLEITATATQARYELLSTPEPRSAERVLADLERKARAAAAARQELR